MTPEINPCDVQEALNRYVEVVQKMQEDYFTRMDFTFSDPPTIVVHYGKKYAKVVKVDGLNGSQSVHSFVNMSNGDILKGNWKAPIRSKGKLAVRGTIFHPDPSLFVSEFGPHYLNSKGVRQHRLW